MRTFVELVERYVDPELCPYPEYKGKPYYSIKYIENGEEHVGYSSYSLQVMSGFLKKYFMSPALEKQEQVNTQSVNLTHTTYPNALESLKILESAKDENGCVPMSLVRLAFRNVLEQDRKETYEKGLSDAWEAARKIANMIDNERFVVLDTFFVDRAFSKNTAAEAIAKIKAWEDGRQEIKVGDEVENTQTSVRFIVTHLWMNNRGEKGVSGFNYECSAFSTALDLVRKTGRHFPEIATVLKKMRGEQDG